MLSGFLVVVFSTKFLLESVWSLISPAILSKEASNVSVSASNLHAGEGIYLCKP